MKDREVMKREGDLEEFLKEKLGWKESSQIPRTYKRQEETEEENGENNGSNK